MSTHKCLVCATPQYGTQPEGQGWCWLCGTYWSAEGNALGLTAEQARHRGECNSCWTKQMLYGPECANEPCSA